MSVRIKGIAVIKNGVEAMDAALQYTWYLDVRFMTENRPLPLIVLTRLLVSEEHDVKQCCFKALKQVLASGIVANLEKMDQR